MVLVALPRRRVVLTANRPRPFRGPIGVDSRVSAVPGFGFWESSDDSPGWVSPRAAPDQPQLAIEDLETVVAAEDAEQDKAAPSTEKRRADRGFVAGPSAVCSSRSLLKARYWPCCAVALRNQGVAIGASADDCQNDSGATDLEPRRIAYPQIASSLDSRFYIRASGFSSGAEKSSPLCDSRPS
jgi:hypothetical protein